MKKHYYLAILILSIILSSCNLKNAEKDYALLSRKNDWSHNFAFGSPSWDTFERFSGNPVYKGRKGMEWPVNGFIYSDPMSKNWYLYIGEYKEFYQSDRDPATVDFDCVVYKSSNKGKNWAKLGNLFPANMLIYDSLKVQVPDVMVTYADGKYHMIFDWLTNNGWQNSAISGNGYAVADSPEGPWKVSKKPLTFNTKYKQNPILGKYWRTYAPMIVKRKNDWAILYMMDANPTSSWALAASISPNPEGPYSDTKIILNVERKTNYQPLQEYFPAFTHDGYVYLPATSVSVNRNYQSIYRVKPEEILNPDKYELFSAGSFWHAENVENEFAGIWGQTISGFVDENDSIYVMFPSKDPANYGTINIAKASWNHLERIRGFNLTANEGNTFSYIKKVIDVEGIDMKFKLDGTMHIIWDLHSPIDIMDCWGKFVLDQNRPDYKEIVIDNTVWKINVFSNGKNLVDSGKVQQWSGSENRLQLKKIDGKYQLLINGVNIWKGILSGNPGITGILLDPHSYLFASQMIVDGRQIKGSVTYGFYQALVNSGNQVSEWTFKNDSLFLYGNGAESKKASSCAKWNFDGKGFEIFSPKGPDYGAVNIYLDGKLLQNLSLKSPQEVKSSSIFKSKEFKMGSHAVYIESLDGLLPLDCIEIVL